MQLTVNKKRAGRGVAGADGPATLLDLREGEQGTLEQLDLPEDIARRLMELGFLPGNRIVAARSAPGGDPRVFRVDGSEIALRRETAVRLKLRRTMPSGRRILP